MNKETCENESLSRIIEEKVNETSDELSRQINESDSRDMGEITKKLDLQSIEDDILKNRNVAEPWMMNSNHQHDYSFIIDGLNGNSTTTKIKILSKLLNSQILDAKLSLWGELSQSLQKCFVSTNKDIFLIVLKIHHRIIAFPNTSCDGYLNLLKSTFLLLNSRYFKDRILLCIKLIIDAQNVVIKFLLHASRTMMDDIITVFISVITFKSVFDVFIVLDPKTTWLRNFCYGSYIRNTFFNNLKEKNADFIKNVATSFVKKINNNEDNSGACYGSFLLYFWQYKNNVKFLRAEISSHSILGQILTKLRQQKNQELTEFVTEIFLHNPALLTPKLLDVLVDPLSSINRTNLRNSIETQTYILTIICNIAKSSYFRLLFESHSLGKDRSRQVTRNCMNVSQKITEMTIILLQVDEFNTDSATILIYLLNCCVSIYESHPVSIIHVNPTKLIQNLYEFYQLNWKNDIEIRDPLLAIFKFFYTWYGPTVNILGCDNEILVDLMSFGPGENLKTVIGRIGCDKAGFEFVKSYRGHIVKPYLEKIWSSEDVNDDSEFTKFVFFLFIIKWSTRSVVALLSDDDDDDCTVVETNDKSVNLVELIEKSLNESGESEEEYLGLLAMKVLIMNLDLLLYLQANHQMQEKLTILQEKEKGFIDAQSSLRNNILITLELLGFVNDVKQMETTELQILPQIFEFIRLNSEDSELQSFLENRPDNGEFSWLSQARRAFKISLDLFNPSLLATLLEQIPKTCVYRKVELNWPPSDCVYYQVHPEDFGGITLITSFGLKTGLLSMVESDTHKENLILLIKQARAFLGHQPENFSNFDWFLGIIYLICSGDFDKCKTILLNFTNTQVTSLIWATFGKEFDCALQENFYQHFAVVLEENCKCFQALKLLEVSPNTLVHSWLNQCFFNYFRFEEICNFLAFSVLYPVECLMYYMVAVFTHLDENICTLVHSPQVSSILQMTDLSNFRLSNYMDLIEKLMKHYRNSHKL